MTITCIRLEHAIGETRAVAWSGERPVALFADPWAVETRARAGAHYPARLREKGEGGAGWFAELEGGEPVFVAGPSSRGLSEGAQVMLEIRAEARSGKRARGVLVKPGTPPPRDLSPERAWQAWLPGARDLTPEDVPPGDHEIDAVFDEIRESRVVLAGGGRLQITRTPALTAIDIDTAGRKARGPAQARAEDLNRAAAAEAARQLVLRGLGGLVVLDCVAPISRQAGMSLRRGFLDNFAAASTRQAEARAPSPFGLMEASLAWRERPPVDIYQHLDGTPTRLGCLLDGLRALEREARAHRGARLTLRLAGEAYEAFDAHATRYMTALQRAYGGRIDVRRAERAPVPPPAYEVFRT